MRRLWKIFRIYYNVEKKNPEEIMSERLIIDGTAVYEIDEDCLRQQEERRLSGRPRRSMGERPVCQESRKKTDKEG